VSDLLRVLAVLGLVGLNAFFVIAEYSVVTARRAALQPRADAGSKRAAAALKLMDDPVSVISTVQVGISAVAILSGAIGEPLVRDLLGKGVPHWLGFLIAVVIITYLNVLLGELVPKALVLERAESLAIAVAGVVSGMQRFLKPVAWLLERSAGLILRPFGVSEVKAGEGIRSAEELRALVDEAEGAGHIVRAQEELIYNVFDFTSQEAGDVMVAAPDVDWLDANLTLEAALDELVEIRHRRLPVGDGSLDRIVGIVTVFDVLHAEREGQAGTVRDIAREVLMVPESKDLGALLREMRDRREQFAIVVSEYGTTQGIVTLEDIVEEIVGEIEEDYELPNAALERIDERTVVVAGSMSIDDFNEATGANLPQDTGSRTLAGLVFSELGRLPDEGEKVAIDRAVLTVEEVDGQRIAKLRVELPTGVPD
jgi:putative hemolysin